MNNEVIRRNILAIKQHSDVTRGQVNDVRASQKAHYDTLETLRVEVEQLRTQVRLLQIKLYSGGATNDNIN